MKCKLHIYIIRSATVAAKREYVTVLCKRLKIRKMTGKWRSCVSCCESCVWDSRKYKAYILKYMACIWKYVPCVFYDKPCIFRRVGKEWKNKRLFCGNMPYLWNSGHGVCANALYRVFFRRLKRKKWRKVEKRAFYFANLTNIVYICLRNTCKDLSNKKKRTQ